MTVESYAWPDPPIVPMAAECGVTCDLAMCTPCSLNIGSCCRGYVICRRTGDRHACPGGNR